jgi:hypothetical protein
MKQQIDQFRANATAWSPGRQLRAASARPSAPCARFRCGARRAGAETLRFRSPAGLHPAAARPHGQYPEAPCGSPRPGSSSRGVPTSRSSRARLRQADALSHRLAGRHGPMRHRQSPGCCAAWSAPGRNRCGKPWPRSAAPSRVVPPAPIKLKACRPSWRSASRYSEGQKVEYVGDLDGIRERHLRVRDQALRRIDGLLRLAPQAGQLAPGVAPTGAARAQHALVDGLISNWMLDRDAFDLRRVGHRAVEQLLAGLSGRAWPAIRPPLRD